MKRRKKKDARGRQWGGWPLLALALLSGATALGHQLLWTRRMIDLLGASAASYSRVFGVFFLGLACGAAVAALAQPRIRRPWRLLALMDVGTALLALPMLLLPAWSDGLWLRLGPEALEGWRGAGLRTVLSVLLVFPSATLMGFFVPVAIPAWPAARRGRGDWGVRLYAVNTLGAVAGILLTAGILIQHLGIFGAMLAVMAGNLAVAAGCLALDRRVPSPEPDAARSVARSRGRLDARWVWAAGASGFLVIGAEVGSLQMLQNLAPLSFHAPAAILATVILALALGAFAVEAWSLNHRATGRHAGIVAGLAAVALAAVPILFVGLAGRMDLLVDGVSLFQFQRRLALFTAAVAGPAFLTAGLLFPVIAVLAGADSGRRWGWLLAANGVGGLLGAEVTYRAVLPALGPHRALGALSLVYVLVGVFFLARRHPVARWALAGLSAGLLAVFVFVHPRLPRVSSYLRPYVVAEYHGREGSLVIIEDDAHGRGMLLANQYLLGTTAARLIQERQAHIPLLVHPAPRRVAHIGVATGMTTGAALLHRDVEEITGIEISRTVADAAATWFATENRGVMTHPRVRLVIDDGRTWIAANRDRFDLVVSDLFLPWGPGDGRLYSREHFAAVRRALRPDGLFCQWLPMYQLTEEHFLSIAATMLEVFPTVEVVIGHPSSLTRPTLGLLASRDEAWLWPSAPTSRDVDLAATGDPLLADPTLLDGLYLGRLRRGEIAGAINTLDNLALELAASRTFITRPRSAPYLSGARWLEWKERFFEGN